MASWDGRSRSSSPRRPTASRRRAGAPTASSSSFLSSRQGAKGGAGLAAQPRRRRGRQADRRQGRRLDYAWSPDSRAWCSSWTSRIRAIRQTTRRRRPSPAEDAAKPIVIDRYHFKSDVDGYLRGERSHLYLFDCRDARRPSSSRRALSTRTSPAWSPDGTQIAFVRRHAGQATSTRRRTGRLRHRRAGRRAAAPPDDDRRRRRAGRLAWSPDGKQIAYQAGDEPKYSAYDQAALAVIPVAGGAAAPADRGARPPDRRRRVVGGRPQR